MFSLLKFFIILVLYLNMCKNNYTGIYSVVGSDHIVHIFMRIEDMILCLSSVYFLNHQRPT